MTASLHIKACLLFEESTAIYQIRDRVFSQEQGIAPSLDRDGQDDQAVHVIASLASQPVGVLRLRELNDTALKLERLAVLADFRHQGIGSELVCTAIAYAQEQGYATLHLHAQIQTVPFYQTLGFIPTGDPFLEAGIEHVAMQQTL